MSATEVCAIASIIEYHTRLSPALLTASGITKRFGSKLVLDGVSLSARESEVLGLIGPNGAGKTTLFECLAGLIPRDSGEISARGDLFYLPDAIRPWPDQRVAWALEFFGGLYSSERAAETARDLKLGPFLDSRIGSLSKGELKRFLLAL